MRTRFLSIALGLYLTFAAGCADLAAWRGGLSYNHRTGQMDGSLKGATGTYNENTGLNIGGENSIIAIGALIFAAILIYTAYPIQRALRIRREKKWLEWQRSQDLSNLTRK